MVVLTATILGAAILLVGLAVIFIAYGKGVPGGLKNKLGAVGVIAVLAGAAVLLVPSLSTPGAQAIDDENPAYDISASESDAHLTFDDDTNTFTWAMNYNTTSNAFVSGTGSSQINFTLARADALIVDSKALGHLDTVGEVDVTGAAAEPVIAQNSDDSYQFKWIKSSGNSFYEDVSILVDANDDAYVNLNVTLSADAVDAMAQYESVDILFTLGGEQFTIHCILATLSS